MLRSTGMLIALALQTAACVGLRHQPEGLPPRLGMEDRAASFDSRPKEDGRHASSDLEEEGELEPGDLPSASESRSDQEAFRRHLEGNLRPFTICFARAMRDDPSAGGRVSFEFTVNADGVVSEARVIRSTLGHTQAERCMVEALRATRFPRPRSGTAVVMAHTFAFSSPRTGASGTPGSAQPAAESDAGPAAGRSSPPTTPPAQENPVVERLRRHLLSDVRPVVDCYRAGVRANPELRGRLDVRFVVRPTGVVREARVVRSTLPRSNVERCVLDAILAHRFPLLVEPGDVTVEHSFSFSPN